MLNDDLDFKYGHETEAYCGCAVSLKGQFWYLGGSSSNKRRVKKNSKIFFANFILYFKITKIIGCELVAQGDLPFEFLRGSCSTFSVPEEKALMCFDYSNTQECHM